MAIASRYGNKHGTGAGLSWWGLFGYNEMNDVQVTHISRDEFTLCWLFST